MKAIRTLLIGHGHLGKWHAEKTLQIPQAKLVGVVDPAELSADSHAVKNDVPRFNSLSEVPVDIYDAVIIATPTSTHYDLLKMSTDLGKHCFVEKPVTEKLQDASGLSPHKELTIQVGHSERYHKVWPSVLAEHKKAPYKHLKACRYAVFKGRALDVSVIHDLMVHDFDLMALFFGHNISRVKATGLKTMSKTWDSVEVCFTWKNGTSATAVAMRNAPFEQRSFCLESHQKCRYIDLLNQKNTQTTSEVPGEVIEESYPRADFLLEEQKAFFEAIATKSTPKVTLDDGIMALKMIEATEMALETQEEISWPY